MNARLLLVIIWLFGTLTQLVPIVSTSGIVSGNVCVKSLIWPNKALSDAYAMIVLIIQYFLPLAILIFSYCKLLLFIRNKQRVTFSSTLQFYPHHVYSDACHQHRCSEHQHHVIQHQNTQHVHQSNQHEQSNTHHQHNLHEIQRQNDRNCHSVHGTSRKYKFKIIIFLHNNVTYIQLLHDKLLPSYCKMYYVA